MMLVLSTQQASKAYLIYQDWSLVDLVSENKEYFVAATGRGIAVMRISRALLRS